jgi:hypothetical protein
MTNTPVREKFATQMDADLLAELRTLAKAEGRQLQVLLEDAVRDLLDAKRGRDVRRRIHDAYLDSLNRFASIYQKLPK